MTGLACRKLNFHFLEEWNYSQMRVKIEQSCFLALNLVSLPLSFSLCLLSLFLSLQNLSLSLLSLLEPKDILLLAVLWREEPATPPSPQKSASAVFSWAKKRIKLTYVFAVRGWKLNNTSPCQTAAIDVLINSNLSSYLSSPSPSPFFSTPSLMFSPIFLAFFRPPSDTCSLPLCSLPPPSVSAFF